MSFEAVATALAGRYTIESEIGSGGMATVYLALDVRHGRRVAVKVLRPELARALGTERFLREIRIAASLNHPNIVPLYDSGEAGGVLYYVMPYVEGESLRSRLDREKQLTGEAALSIATQIAAALSYAHAQGIVHRDIKPDNILLSSGQAVVTDFGVARAVQAASGAQLTATGLAIGTPAYMSPEQAAGSEDIDARTDQYSLACTVFEMLAGEPPFSARTPGAMLARQMTESAPDLLAMRDTLPPVVAAAVKRAMAKAPVDRFSDVAEFSAALAAGTPAQSAGSKGFSAHKGKVFATAGFGVVVLAAVILLSGAQPVPFEKRDWVVVTDFDNRTGDTLFDGTLDMAFTVGLQQSRYVNVFPRTRVRETLTHMGRDAGTSLDESLAREVALRRGLRAVVTAAITRLGTQYSLTTHAVDPATGNVLVSRSARADEATDVLDALDDLAGRLRKDLGEPLLSRLRNNVELDQATTPSLEALRAWTAGNQQWQVGQFDAAASLYQRAVAIDSTFAMAHLDLGQYYYWRYNDRQRGDAHFDRALALVDRVTERERSIIEARSAGWRGNSVRAIEAYNIHLAAYPDDQVSWNNLGYEFLRSQRWDEAAEAYRRAIVLDSLDDNALVNLATVYNASGQHEEAIDAYARSFDLNPAHRLNTNIVHEYGFNLIALNELEAADEAFRWLLDGNREAQSLGHRSMAMLRLYKGRFADAIEHLEQSVLLDGFGSPPTTALRNRAFLSSAVLRTRGAEAARRVLMPALEILDSAYIAPYFLAPVGMLFAQVGEPGTATVLLDTLAARAGEQNDADQGALQFLAGHIALAREATDSARAHFRRAVIFTNENNPEYLAWLARTQILLGDLDAAQTSLESVVGQATTGREGLEMWVRAHYDLARLHDEAGDTEQAIRWYAAFLDLWDQADEGLDPVPDARQRLASLTADRR